jgi:hypothetical protein
MTLLTTPRRAGAPPHIQPQIAPRGIDRFGQFYPKRLQSGPLARPQPDHAPYVAPARVHTCPGLPLNTPRGDAEVAHDKGIA